MTAIVSKPEIGARIINDGVASDDMQVYLDDLQEQLNTVAGAQVTLTSYTVATLPIVTSTAGLIFVSNETGGAVPAFSDGTNWRRTTDRAIVS